MAMKIIPPEQIGTYLKQARNENILPIFYLELDTYPHVTDQMQGVMVATLPDEQPDPPQDSACKVIEFKRAMNI